MALSFDEIWCYSGQMIVSAHRVETPALGAGLTKMGHSMYVQGPSQFGYNKDFYALVPATVNIGRPGYNSPMTLNQKFSLYVKGNTRLQGDGRTAHGLKVSGGSSVDSLFVDGDVYVTGSVDCLSKGRLEARHSVADGKPKPFDIQHPTKGEGYRLRYACIEGPEVGVYCRGRLRNQTEIALPDYWKDLVHVESISVHIQPIRAHQDIIVKRWDDEKIYLQSQGGLPIDCFYHVYGERKDVNPLHVEYEGDDCFDYPDPNYKPGAENPIYNDPQYAGLKNTVTI